MLTKSFERTGMVTMNEVTSKQSMTQCKTEIFSESCRFLQIFCLYSAVW